VKYNFSKNPLLPLYQPACSQASPENPPLAFQRFEGGLVHLGASLETFTFDNERPRHRRFLEPFEIATRLVTNAEMLEFVTAGGYRDPALWLSDGWAWVHEQNVEGPLYWRKNASGEFEEFTAHGLMPLDPHAPVCHVSGYEALAFATFAGARLPTEFEWELAARRAETPLALSEARRFHPRGSTQRGLSQLFGEVWQWTRSSYEPYPGFVPEAGAVGEYNGKFMNGQWVLRGSSVATPHGHTRPTYRNFFYPHQRWPFTGIRLAREIAL
jgi:ergothioneine biosynthesis protein EgtB